MLLTLPRILMLGLILFLSYASIATSHAYVIDVYGNESDDRTSVVYRLDSEKEYAGFIYFVCSLNTLYYRSSVSGNAVPYPFYDYKKNMRYCVIRKDLILVK